MENLDEDDYRFAGEWFRPVSRYPNSHHSSPLIIYPQRHILNLFGGVAGAPSTKKFKTSVLNMKVLAKRTKHFRGFTDNGMPVFVGLLHQSLLTLYDSCNEGAKQLLEAALQVCTNEVNADLNVIEQENPGLTHLTKLLTLTQPELQDVSSSISNAYGIYQGLLRVRTNIQTATINGNQMLCGPEDLLDYKVYFDESLIYVITGGDSAYGTLFNYDQLIMMTDTVACRYLCLLTCELNDKIGLEPFPPAELLRDVYKWGDELLESHGEDGYQVIGEFESFVTSVFVMYPGSDPLHLGDSYLDSLMLNAHSVQKSTGIPVLWTTRILELLRSVQSPNSLSELFGLRKHWGNPIVDAALSGREVQNRVLEDLHISGPALEKLLASFNRMICLEYIRIHGCWPDCHFKDTGEDYPLRLAQQRGITRIPEHMPEHDHFHWSLLTFRSNCVIDSYSDQLTLLTDKSVSVYREHLGTIYVRALSSHLATMNVPECRRIILEFIRRNHFSVCDILKVVMSHAIPLSWLSNSAAMKGTEMKQLKARIFAVLTFELRQYFAATEDILSNHVFKYNPHQTMTLNENQLLAKLRDITRQMNTFSDSRALHVIHIIDFSKWNLRMKYANTCLIFKSIDDFLGTPGLIESTHNIFWELLNVVQDPFNPPEHDPTETASDTVWTMHDCGWEGQRQKGWTLLTSALLSDVERITGVYSQICGQGDNQVLLSRFPVPGSHSNAAAWIRDMPDQVRMIVDRFYMSLEKECTAVGLRVKTAETCRSLSFFNYGKRLYFNGIELSMTLKRISKSETEPNDSFPTTEAQLKTLEGTIYSSGLFSHPGIMPYLMSRVVLYLSLNNAMTNNLLVRAAGKSIIESFGVRLNPKFISILMRIPASLGGPPQLPLSAYLFRGHPDPLCSDLVLLVLRARNNCDISQRIIFMVNSGKWFTTPVETVQALIAAPHSLNIQSPQAAHGPMLNEVMVSLRYECKNRDLRGVFSMSADSYEKQLLDIFETAYPMQPAVLNDIFGRTLPGRRRSFIMGLKNTTSLNRLVKDSGIIPLHTRIANLERQHLSLWVNRVMDVCNIIIDTEVWFDLDPHWVLARRWRDLSWERSVEGVTVPHPLEQFKILKARSDLCQGHTVALPPEHIVIIRHSEGLIALPGSDSRAVQLLRSDSGSPYLGSTVTEGIIQRDVDCLNPSGPWRDAIRLNMIRQWVCAPEGPLDITLKDIIATRTDTPLLLLNKATGRPSRLSYNHRALLMSTTRTCAPTATTNMHSRIYLSSNRMGKFSHGDVNYHMPFGPCFLSCQMLIAMDGVGSGTIDSWGDNPREVFHAHVRYTSNPIVYDGLMEIKSKSRMMRVPAPPPLFFAKSAQLALVSTTMSSTHEIWTPQHKTSEDTAKVCYCHQLLGDLVLQEVIVRESLTVNILTDYVHRENPITIRDIKLVSAARLVQAVGMSLILVSPIDVGQLHHKDSLYTSVSAFLDTFSRSFWSQLTPPFLNQVNLKSLQSLCPYMASFQVTRSTAGVIVLLKAAICRSIWSTVQDLTNCLMYGEPLRHWAIYSPGLHSGKFLWSKFVEFCCFIMLPQVGASERETVDVARDLAAEINGSDIQLFIPVMWRVKEQFQTAVCHFRGSEALKIPEIHFYNLCEPWIDRLRRATSEEHPIGLQPTFKLPRVRAGVVSLFRIHSSINELTVEQDKCHCPPLGRSLQPHYECFFMPTGLLSKSHYRFLEVIAELQLNVGCVVCLGSSTGSEAAAISMLDSCTGVYVNCLLPITTFAPHTAGTYIPPAFLVDGRADKLILSSHAATTVNDLLLPETINTITEHVALSCPTGITCDVEMPSEDDMEVQIRLLRKLIELCSALSTVRWLVVKVVANCHHELERLICLAGYYFSQITIINSCFSRAKSKQVFLGCYSKHPRSGPPLNEANLVRLDNIGYKAWTSLVVPTQLEEYPRIFHEEELTRVQLMSVAGPSRNSLSIACGVIIEGWGLEYFVAPSKEQVINDLDLIASTLNAHAVKLLGTFSRVDQDYSMVRSQVLIINDVHLERQVNQIGEKYARAQLMIKLLTPNELVMDDCMSCINDFIGEVQELPLLTQKFEIRINPTRFINYHSRFVFEVLGHLYKHKVKLGIRDTWSRNLHIGRPEVTHDDSGGLPLELNVTERAARADHRWTWFRRSKVLSIFLPMLTAGITIRGVWLADSHLHNIKSLWGYSGKLKCEIVSYSDPRCELTWVHSYDEFNNLYMSKGFPTYVCAPALLYNRIALTAQIIEMHALPWSGVVPQMVMYRCSWGRSTSTSLGFPNTAVVRTHGWLIGRSLIACCCYSCSLEVKILTTFGLDHSLLDRCCSQHAIESIRDLRHPGF